MIAAIVWLLSICTQLRQVAEGDIVPILKRLKKYRSYFKILYLDFPKTWLNQYIKSKKVATFEKLEIFSNLYFSYVQYYKATLLGGNKFSNLVIYL